MKTPGKRTERKKYRTAFAFRLILYSISNTILRVGTVPANDDEREHAMKSNTELAQTIARRVADMELAAIGDHVSIPQLEAAIFRVLQEERVERLRVTVRGTR